MFQHSIIAQSLDPDWNLLKDQFIAEYQNLNIPGLRIAYLDNLNAIQDLPTLEKQAHFFKTFQLKLAEVNPNTLPEKERLDFELVQYACELELERTKVSLNFESQKPDTITSNGLYHLPNGKDWYRWFLRKWLDLAAHPDSLFLFGLNEIQKVKSQIKIIQQKSGLDSIQFYQYIQDPSFFYPNAEAVQKAFENFDSTIQQKLIDFFPKTNQIPKLKIERGRNERLAQVPGFYGIGTFYYNVFDRPFNKRQVAWLYMHEGLPGHHYEIAHRQFVDKSDIQQLFYFPGYAEGWAAYIEEIGKEIGAYATIYDELGKWEWDLIRSVRVPLDVGINYYGWDDEKALQFWKKHITNQDNIGQREIARIKRWPVQVITYKYGAQKIMQWKRALEKDTHFNLKKFHKQILKFGPIPFSILEKRLFEQFISVSK